MIQTAFGARLMPAVGGAGLLASCLLAAELGTVAMSTVATAADDEDFAAAAE
jgi:hypothetical protein